MLREASEQGPSEPLYMYVYGVALHSSGAVDAGLELLENAHERFPGYAPTLFALATMQRDAGDLDKAREFARRLVDVSPGDPGAQALAAELSVDPRR